MIRCDLHISLPSYRPKLLDRESNLTLHLAIPSLPPPLQFRSSRHPRSDLRTELLVLGLCFVRFSRFGLFVGLNRSKYPSKDKYPASSRTLFVTKCIYHASRIIVVQLKSTMRSVAKRNGSA
jgi:hypothetical protein